MTATIEARMVEYMRPLFGEFAVHAFEQQKAELGVGETATAGDYIRLAEAITAMCAQIAGPAVADKVYTGLVSIVRDVA